MVLLGMSELVSNDFLLLGGRQLQDVGAQHDLVAFTEIQAHLIVTVMVAVRVNAPALFEERLALRRIDENHLHPEPTQTVRDRVHPLGERLGSGRVRDTRDVYRGHRSRLASRARGRLRRRRRGGS